MKIAASVNGLAAFGGGATPEPPRNVDPDVVNAALEAQLFAAGIPIADF